MKPEQTPGEMQGRAMCEELAAFLRHCMFERAVDLFRVRNDAAAVAVRDAATDIIPECLAEVLGEEGE